MANTQLSIAKNLAENLLYLRKQRNLSQAAVAALADLPRSTITYIESGAGNPSLQNLVKVASALEVGVEELIRQQNIECTLYKAKDVHRVQRKRNNIRIYKLLPNALPRFEIDRMEFQAGAVMGGVPHLQGTKEYFTCVKGCFVVIVSGQKFVVEKNDVLAFSGDQAHSYRNESNSLSVAISVVALAPLRE